ncbi:restriction endonuclease subunit S [Gardnerella pickettii]|uniref:restriction endonuclease subunit S n=1 Tax=Gardnerella pickettii TaxID=2914924 RepID=UPI0003541D6C|nr:restriction endonuclease subunit S [Gardnerella pickettii]EPI59008.1 hypothetical protein HMPREF1579_01017 [Gardnerella vaginalis JCP8066]KXA15891.1 hypothetical protein HMPREF3204_00684 [Gardnerella pickettii]MDF2278675.1 restriction endonuclease subunit S [Gardnerella pickettii]MDK6472039.1 restriction endonuclease subunit S [Bifidobacterium sp. UMB9259]
MNRIDTSKWKPFAIGELFEVKRPVARSQAAYSDGNVPFVASGNFNNGVVKYCEPKDNEALDAGNCITVSPLDGSAFYQAKDFLGRGGAGSAILLLYSDKLTELTGLFIAAAIRASLTRYSYIDQLNSQTIVEEHIKLPADKSGSPDWAYMDSFMQNVMNESKACLGNLRLAKEEKSAVDVSSWLPFKIGDLFEKLQLNIKNPDFNKTLDVSEEQTREFNLPLVNAKHGNNGIMYYGRESDFETAEMTIDIVQNGAIATGDVYAQPQKTGALWDAYLIKPFADIQSEYTLMFLSTVIERSIKEHFSYEDKCVWNKVSQLYVSLPVDKAGCPDWAYMNSRMEAVLTQSKKSMKELREVNY